MNVVQKITEAEDDIYKKDILDLLPEWMDRFEKAQNDIAEIVGEMDKVYMHHAAQRQNEKDKRQKG